MQLWIDDQPCDTAVQTIGEAIATGATVAEDGGRVIIEVVVDGDRWTDRELGDLDVCGGTATEVRLTSADMRVLVRETLGQCAVALEEAASLEAKAAEAIQADRTADAMADLGTAVELWLSVQAAVGKGCTMVGIDLGAVEVDGVAASACISALTDQLHMLRDALEVSDPIGLSDTLLYEMPDVHRRWQGMLDRLETLVVGQE